MAYYQVNRNLCDGQKAGLGYSGDASNADYWYNFNQVTALTNIVQVVISDAMLAITDVVVASPSNSTPAPARRVGSRVCAGRCFSAEEYVPGETLELKFKVELKDEDFPVKREELTGDQLNIGVDGSGQTKIRITDCKRHLHGGVHAESSDRGGRRLPDCG